MLTVVPEKSPSNRYFYLVSALWVGSPTYMPRDFIHIPSETKGFSRKGEPGKSAGQSMVNRHLSHQLLDTALLSTERKIKSLDSLR